MDETIMNPVQTENTDPVADTFQDEDSWDDIDLSDVSDNEVRDAESEEEVHENADEENADQQEESAEENDIVEEEETNENDQEKRETKTDQPFLTLKHLGVTHDVTKDEAVVLAQKGMNYDHVKGERDTARAEVERLKEYESFLNELAAPQGMSIPDLIDATKAQVIADRDGIDKEIALQRVKLDRERKAFEAEKLSANNNAKAQQEEDRKRTESFVRFVQEFPDVEVSSIDKAVWDYVRDDGLDLSHAYLKHERTKLEEEVKSLKDKVEKAEQNEKNRARSTGSQRSSVPKQDMDDIDRSWYDGT